MTHPAAHVDTAPILHELDRISAILNAQVEEERTGRRPDTQVITQACASLAVLAESMRDVEDEVRTWAGELAELFMGVSTKLARIDLTDSFGYFSDFCVNTCSSQMLAQIFVLLELINTIVRNTCGIVNAWQQYICKDYKNSL